MSTITVRIGERYYEFESHEDVTKARAIYATCVGDQDAFETEMECQDIEFCLHDPEE